MFRKIFRTAIERLAIPIRNRVVGPLTDRLIYRRNTSPELKVGQRLLYQHYRNQLIAGSVPTLPETGFRNFSQFEEDGQLLFIFAMLGIAEGTFVDIGSADGIRSNCANLALNFGWRGVFIDGDKGNIARGRSFYRNHPDTWQYPPKFVHAMVAKDNINQILKDANVPADVDLMSIDIDGNDYWIWEAIDSIAPKVVIIETHVEFGMRSIVVPYEEDYVYPGKHPDYHGASPVAMRKLAERKGYRLVGSNAYGFNTIYILHGLADTVIPAIPAEQVLCHPRNTKRAALFEPIKDWPYIEV